MAASSGTGTGTASGGGGSSGSPDAPQDCPENIHDGDIRVFDAPCYLGGDQVCVTDLETLGALTEVAGVLWIQEAEFIGADLSALRCLETVGELWIDDVPDIVNLEGAGRLEEIDVLYLGGNPNLVSLAGLQGAEIRSLRVYGNPKLESLAGLEGVEIRSLSVGGNPKVASLAELNGLQELDYLEVTKSPSISDLQFDQLQHAGTISIGGCEGLAPDGGPGLTDIVGLDGLRTVDELYIQGNESLVTLDGLRDLAEAGLVVGSVTIRHNPLLPAEEAAQIVDLFGNGFTCGNQGDEREECVDAVGGCEETYTCPCDPCFCGSALPD